MVEESAENPQSRGLRLTRRKFLKTAIPIVVPLVVTLSSNFPNSDQPLPDPNKTDYGVRYAVMAQSTTDKFKNSSISNENTNSRPQYHSYQRKELPSSRISGFNFPSWWSGEYQLSSTQQALRNLSPFKQNFIGITPTQYQTDISSSTIGSTANTPSDADLASIIDYSHTAGYHVMLKPHINLSNDPGHWHGQIGQTYTNEQQWKDWFISYQKMINHYASFAEQTGVELFIMGNEYISSSVTRPDDWKKVIAGVRSNYSGPITYAAHMYDFAPLSWWSDLDLLGLNPYYDLTKGSDPNQSELNNVWNYQESLIEPVVNRWKKRLVFPEIGYLSAQGTNMHPWDIKLIDNPQVPVDLQEQANCISALYQSFWDKPWWYGVFWWFWSTDPNNGGINDKGYSPNGKPAAQIISAYSKAIP